VIAPYHFHLDSSLTPFIPSSPESRVVIHRVRAVVMLLLHHLDPHPFEPPFSIGSPPTDLGRDDDIQQPERSPCCWSSFVLLFYYSIRSGVDILVVLYCKLFTEQR